MKYKVFFPLTMNMSPIYYPGVSDKFNETKEEEALWHYNRSRDHDGLNPIDYLPKGTYFVPIEE